MTTKKILEIKHYAITFRKAIEQAQQDGAFKNDFFNCFPYGCCGDASNLLATYLLEKRVHSSYVCGFFHYDYPELQSQSHAWLQCRGGIIIDITGDQFSTRSEFLNYDISVYVGQIDKMHQLFDVEERNIHTAGIENICPFNLSRLQSIYSEIKKRIV